MSTAQTTRFDDVFFMVAKEAGGIEGLLSALFSFLYRRTDYFYESDPGDKMGFPPGVAIKMVKSRKDLFSSADQRSLYPFLASCFLAGQYL
jgi:hypothetical protein